MKAFSRPDLSYHRDTDGSYLNTIPKRTAPLIWPDFLSKINLLYFILFYYLILIFFFFLFYISNTTYYFILPSDAGGQVLDAVCICSGRAAKTLVIFMPIRYRRIHT